MFIRTKDNVKVVDNNYQYFTFLNTTRKGNFALKFELAQNDIKFFADELSIRMIPKDKVYILQEKEIKIITTEDGLSLIYQDFNEEPVQFVTPDDDTDELHGIDFFDLIPDQTEICCYDLETEGYYYSKVAYTSLLVHTIGDDAELDIQSLESNKVFVNELNTLSRYIIGGKPKEGIILNGIMVI